MINLHWKIEEHFKVKIGGNIFIDIPNLIMYGDEPLFKIYRSTSDGLLGIDFDIYDKNGNKIATIRKGMIVQGDEKNYNISYREVVDHYKISEKKSGRIICRVMKLVFINFNLLFEATLIATYIPGFDDFYDIVFQSSV